MTSPDALDISDTPAEAAPQRLRVFLSYARPNKPRVAKIAAGLEAAGLDVWWDPAIEAGSTFSDEIAHELEIADAIVVVWSKAAIASAWVRDEADVGRQRGRLVPVLIEPVQPPLGFRQLHATDLGDWHGQPDDAAFRSVISAIERVAGGTAVRAPAAAPPRPPWRLIGRGLLSLVVLAGLAFAGYGYLGNRHPDTTRPTVAVLPFTNMTQGGQPYFAQGLAEEILDSLARNKRVRVLGSASARSIRANDSDPGFARRALGVDWLLDGSVRGGANASDRIKVSVQLIDTSDGSAVWAQAFDRGGADLISVQEEIAKAVETQISGTISGPEPRPANAPRAPVSPEAFSKILVARQLIRTRKPDALRAAFKLADEAIALDGTYALAYATRASAAILGTVYVDDRVDRNVEKASRRDAEKAIALDPNLSDGYDALGVVLVTARDIPNAIVAGKRAVALNPGNAEAQLHLAFHQAYNGQIAAAIKTFQAASAIDPMWAIPVASTILNSELINAPAIARATAERFRGLVFDPALGEWLTAAEANARGDYGTALRAATAAVTRDPASYIARLAQNIAARALMASLTAPGTGEPFAVASRRSASETADEGLRLGDAVWNESRAATAMAWSLVHLGRDAELLRSFDRRFSSVAAFAAANVPQEQTEVPLALALARQGRTADAAAMWTLAEKSLGQLDAGGIAAAQTANSWAVLELARGSRAAAATRLMRGAAQQWWVVCRGPVWIGDTRLFASLHSDPQFTALVQDCATRINQQRKLAGLPPLNQSGA